MIPTQEMMMIITPTFSALFVGFWILLAMAWVMNVDEIAQGRARRAAVAQTEEGASDAGASDAGASVAGASDAGASDAGCEEVKPSTVTQEVFNSLYKTVQEEKANSNRMQQSLYQMLGGLFNHETQKKTMMYDVRYLLNKTVEDCGECPYETAEDTLQRQKEHTYPTTRQGDESATKIAQMEETLAEAVRSIEMLQKELKDEKERNVNRASDTNEVFMRLSDLESSDIDHEIMLKLIMGGEYRSQNQKPQQQQQPLQPWYGDEE
jgi:hypothetical protein